MGAIAPPGTHPSICHCHISKQNLEKNPPTRSHFPFVIQEVVKRKWGNIVLFLPFWTTCALQYTQWEPCMPWASRVIFLWHYRIHCNTAYTIKPGTTFPSISNKLLQQWVSIINYKFICQELKIQTLIPLIRHFVSNQ